MKSATLSARLAPLFLTCFALPALADDPLPGWQLSSEANPAPFSATCTLPGGDIVTFDGLAVDRWTSGGAFLSNLVTLPSFTFASFIVASPDGSAVVFGESSNHDILRVNVDGSGFTTLANLVFNYDAEFLPGGGVVVSAATGGFGAGNDLFVISGAPPVAVQIGHVAGPSGPLAVSPAGDLYYATQVDTFPPPTGSTDVVRWTAAQVAAGGLTDANATLIGADFDGGSSMAVDPVSGKVYLGETNFGLGEYRVVQVKATKASSPIVVDDGANFISNLEPIAAGGLGSFEAFQPEDGRNLKYNAGGDQFTIRPLQPVLTATGPGTTGPGPITFTVTGGPLGGTFFASACPQAFLLPAPVAIQMPTFLWVTSFDLAPTRRASSFVHLNGQGSGTLMLNNPGTLQGMFAWQFLVGDDLGTFSGSTTTEIF